MAPLRHDVESFQVADPARRTTWHGRPDRKFGEADHFALVGLCKQDGQGLRKLAPKILFDFSFMRVVGFRPKVLPEPGPRRGVRGNGRANAHGGHAERNRSREEQSLTCRSRYYPRYFGGSGTLF